MFSVAPGEQVRDVCPFCGGGRTKERSFVAINEGGVIRYICHRGSCGKKGVWLSDSEVSASLTPSKPAVKPWPHKYTPPKQELKSFASKYRLSDADLARLRPMKCTDDYGHSRWWYPIFGPHGSVHGGQARTLEPIRPETLTFVEDGYSLGSWYVKDGAETVALVEDQVSACKLAERVTTVALMGCHLNDTLLMFLAKHTKHLKIALDYDALDKATKMAQRVAPYFHSVQVIPLTVDIKNMENLDGLPI